MAEQDFLAALQGLSSKMDSFNNNLGAIQITPFDGNPKEFRRWIKAVEKHAALESVPLNRIKFIAFKTSKDAVSDFIQRYLKNDPNIAWDDLKQELAIRFAEISDPQHAFMVLKTVKQKKDENVQIFAERLLSLAEQAYEGAAAAVVTEGQLVGFFIDGLYSDRLKLKVMRDNPPNMQAAINSARAEYNLQQRFQLRTGRNVFVQDSNVNEPMDIEHYRYKRSRNEYVRPMRQGQTDRRKFPSRQVHEVQKPRPKSEITCWACNRKGHYSSECPHKNQSGRQNTSTAYAVDEMETLN